jgi:hypothetical protein
MVDMTPEAVERLAKDLDHTGELDMLYRCEIADTLRAMSARVVELERNKNCFQRMTRAHWEALCAMRNSINEYIPMPNTDSGPLFSPEDGPIYADISERVIADLKESRAYALALEQELKARTDAAEARVVELEAENKRLAGSNADWLKVANARGWQSAAADLDAAVQRALDAALTKATAQQARVAELEAERDSDKAHEIGRASCRERV